MIADSRSVFSCTCSCASGQDEVTPGLEAGGGVIQGQGLEIGEGGFHGQML